MSLLCCAVVACGGRAYVYQAVESIDFRSRAETQSDGPVTVNAAVLGKDETEAIFGVPLYDQGIQPVWLEIENRGSERVRYAPVSTDRDYFSPLEVAYKNRRKYSGEGRKEMEVRFDEVAMPRYISAGSTGSGFVFTQADNGAKGFNVDLFGTDEFFHFTFILRVPGFEPDYANVDFDSIYPSEQLSSLSIDELKLALAGLPCCTTANSDDEDIGPINIALVGPGQNLLTALLRSGWRETAADESAKKEAHYLFGRLQDALFQYHSRTDDSYYELRLWLAPILAGDERVWAGHVQHFFKLAPAIFRADPDVDHARYFAFQNLIYGQSLGKIGWLAGAAIAPDESFWANLVRPAWFTDGYRAVFWLSAEPVAIFDGDILHWDRPEEKLQ